MTEQQESSEIIRLPINIDKKAVTQLFERYGSLWSFTKIHLEFMELFIDKQWDECFTFLLENYPKDLIISLVANALQMQKVLMEALKDEIDTPTEH